MQALRLYRRILKCHNVSLMGEMKRYHNTCVKDEFMEHFKSGEAPEKFQTFLKSWERYVQLMEKRAAGAKQGS